MIKVHSVSGLKYFCKTQKEFGTKAFDNYKGSGKYWRRHIKKHGEQHVYNELVIGPYTNKNELVNLATYVSDNLNIVDSEEWANLRTENGIEGNPVGIIFSKEWHDKMSIANSGENNGMFGKGYLLLKDKNGFYGKTHTDEMINYLSDIKKGANNPMFGKEGAKPPKCSCVYCKTETTSNALARWHTNCAVDC